MKLYIYVHVNMFVNKEAFFFNYLFKLFHCLITSLLLHIHMGGWVDGVTHKTNI